MMIEPDRLSSFVHGWVAQDRSAQGVRFLRFTEKEAGNYLDPEQYNYDGSRFYDKTFASSGIAFEAVTDARNIVMEMFIEYGSSRTFCYFDIAVDGTLCGHVGSEDFTAQKDFTLIFPLDGGKHRIKIYFPCLCTVTVRHVDLQEASLAEPVQKKGCLLAYGDSITQGYDARYPSLAYPNQLADELDFQVINKGIGGDQFRPQLLAEPNVIKPDMITVGYGTNDWSHSPREILHRDSRMFYDRLTELYPGVPVFAILPIWRGNYAKKETRAGTFFEVAEYFRSVCAPHPQIHVVEGWSLVPHIPAFFSPDVLHPNDFGFQMYGKNLIRAVREAGIE